jgi:hypothetical protein
MATQLAVESRGAAYPDAVRIWASKPAEAATPS